MNLWIPRGEESRRGYSAVAGVPGAGKRRERSPKVPLVAVSQNLKEQSSKIPEAPCPGSLRILRCFLIPP